MKPIEVAESHARRHGEEELQRIRKSQPPDAAGALSQLYRSGKKYAEAMEVFNQMSTLDPESNAIKLARASLLAETGKVDEAVAEVRKLHTGERPRIARWNWPIAQFYERGKRYAEMAKALDAAEKLSETPQEKEGVHFMRGAMYEHLKKYDAAEAEFRKVLEIDPENAGDSELSRLHVGRSRAEAGRGGQADRQRSGDSTRRTAPIWTAWAGFTTGRTGCRKRRICWCRRWPRSARTRRSTIIWATFTSSRQDAGSRHAMAGLDAGVRSGRVAGHGCGGRGQDQQEAGKREGPAGEGR